MVMVCVLWLCFLCLIGSAGATFNDTHSLSPPRLAFEGKVKFYVNLSFDYPDSKQINIYNISYILYIIYAINMVLNHAKFDRMVFVRYLFYLKSYNKR